MVIDHNSQGETRPDRQQTHLDGGHLLVGIHVPPGPPRRVVPVRRLLPHVLAQLGQAVHGRVGRGIPVRLAAPDVPVHPLDRRPLRGGRRRRSVPARPVALAGLLDVPGAVVQAARVVPVVPADLVAVVPADPVVPVVGSRPASPARISRPLPWPPRRRRRQPRGDAAAP